MEAFVLATELLFILLLITPVAEVVTKLLIAIWRLYDAYVRLWTLGSAAVLIVQITVCAIVGSFYLPLLRAYTDRPKKREERECSVYHHVKIAENFPDIRALMPAFEQYIVMERFLPVAFQYRLLSMEEMDKIQKGEGRAMRVAQLVDILERKGPDCVTRVISCFDVTREELIGHAELADIIQRALERHKATENCTADTQERRDAVSLEREIDNLAQKLKTDTQTLASLTENLRQKRTSENSQT